MWIRLLRQQAPGVGGSAPKPTHVDSSPPPDSKPPASAKDTGEAQKPSSEKPEAPKNPAASEAAKAESHSSSGDSAQDFVQAFAQINSAELINIANDLYAAGTDDALTSDSSSDIRSDNSPSSLKEQEKAKNRQADRQQQRADDNRMMDMQQRFKALMSNEQRSQKTEDKRHDDVHQEKQVKEGKKAEKFLRANGDRLQKDYSGADWKKANFGLKLPKGYQAFMEGGPRGKTLFLNTQQALKGQGEMSPEDAALHEALHSDGKDSSPQKTAKQGQAGALQAQKKMAKQLGMTGGKETDEAEEVLNLAEEEGAEEIGEGEDGLAALRRAMGAKAFKAKGKEGEEGEVQEQLWSTFGEAIESHTALFVAADNAESAELVSQANFAGAVIMGAAIHLKTKGGRLNYSGTSHHGLPIPSGDEALDIGRDQVVAGFERDIGQLGVETVFVNGQRFELANPEDEQKLKALIQENPDLYQVIQDLREAMREGRFYRTCLGLMEDSAGRA